MARAGPARSNNTDDIPLAKRASPRRRPSSRQVRFSVLFTILVGAFFGLLVTNRSFRPSFLDSDLAVEQVPSSDGRLLGHFPYAEVQTQDLIVVYPGLEIHKDAYNSLMSLREAAAAAGIDLVFLSGYRSHLLQEEIFFQVKSDRNQTALERARVSAPPGYSEHSTGYAIDFGDGTRRETDFQEEFETTRAFDWLRRNAAKYHFTLSFPPNNYQGVTYEPWHWRFEGTAEALRLFEPSNRFNKGP